MSALVMMLSAALVAGSAPEKVSGEVKQGLDLRGEWAGSWRHQTGTLMVATLAATPEPGETERFIEGRSKSRIAMFPVDWIINEGNGRFRIAGTHNVGIYAWKNDKLFLCFSDASKGYPTSFYTGREQVLITLHRVKPRK